MKSKVVRLIILGAVSALATLLTAQWMIGNIAVQIGGTGNEIHQEMKPIEK